MEIEKKVQDIYNDCWKSYKEYLQDHNIGKYNERSYTLKEKYDNEPFLTYILYAMAIAVNSISMRERDNNDRT